MRDATISARKKLGLKTVVVLPVHYPRELFTAMDVHTVELWGPPGPPRGPDAGRIQPYACAVVRNALAFLASGGADAADAVLFPHTCDSIQGLATLAPDFGGWGKPALRYLHPKGEDGPAARAFVRAELEHLAGDLARLTGRPWRPHDSRGRSICTPGSTGFAGSSSPAARSSTWPILRCTGSCAAGSSWNPGTTWRSSPSPHAGSAGSVSNGGCR